MLRSAQWFDRDDIYGFIHRAFTKASGYSHEDLQRPIIGIAQTWSEANHCNSHLRGIAEAVKRGVWQAGGTPLEFPTLSLSEIPVKPTTMAAMAETLGMTLPGCASILAVDSRRLRLAEASGKRLVESILAGEDRRPSRIMIPAAFENAIRVCMAIGGSTNAVIHLVAIAGRLGIRLPLELFDQISIETPFIANIKPSGQYQSER